MGTQSLVCRVHRLRAVSHTQSAGKAEEGGPCGRLDAEFPECLAEAGLAKTSFARRGPATASCHALPRLKFEMMIVHGTDDRPACGTVLHSASGPRFHTSRFGS